MVPLYKSPESALEEDDDHIPSTELELSSTTLAPTTSASTAGGDPMETLLGTAKVSPPTELSISENEACPEFWKRFSGTPEGSPSSICLDGTCEEVIEANMRWIEVDEASSSC